MVCDQASVQTFRFRVLSPLEVPESHGSDDDREHCPVPPFRPPRPSALSSRTGVVTEAARGKRILALEIPGKSSG